MGRRASFRAGRVLVLVAAALGISLLTTATPAPGASPGTPPVYPGAQYAGRAGNFSYVTLVGTSQDGRAISSFFDQFDRGRCSDGRRYRRSRDVRGRWAIINDSATVSKHWRRAYIEDKAGRRIRGAEWMTVRLYFAGDRLTGTLRDHFRARGLRCASDTIALLANRVGTEDAPLYDAGALTGTYSGKSPDGPWHFTAYVPLHMITEVSYHSKLHCPHGKAFAFRTAFVDVPLKPYSNDQDYFIASATAKQHHGPRGNGYTIVSSLSAEGWITVSGQTVNGQVTLHATAQFNASVSVTLDEDFGNAQVGQCGGAYTVGGGTPTTVVLPPGASEPYRTTSRS